MKKKLKYTLSFVSLLFCLLASCDVLAQTTDTLDVAVSRTRVQRGDTVEITFDSAFDVPIHAVLFTPTVGPRDLQLTSSGNNFQAQVAIKESDPEGIYLVHAWTGERSAPSSVGKASFLNGRIVNDFFIPAYLDKASPLEDLQKYLKEFRAIGGNLLIAHNLIVSTKALYPSKIASTDVTVGSNDDLVEMTLSAADKEGLPVLLSVSWDMTKQSAYKDRMSEIKSIASELYQLYKHHPALAGFYSYQEGSGTYYVPYVREFTEHIKKLNPNLLTACAPHVDDPLLAGYLSTVDELDIIIYQAGVMASYRTDNRKMYPFRRVKDFCLLGVGAKRLQNKISINHVELFGYLENRLTPDTVATTYDNIFQQILSASTVTASDGISFFTYQAHVYETSKKLPQVAKSRAAVLDGMKLFELISQEVSHKSTPLAVYFPYSDWIIERWHNYFLPALDAFRVLGVPVDVLPYAPPVEESVYPYYPFHANKDVINRLLNERTVLVLPNVSGFQQTDSDLIKEFVEQGGVVVAFGPQVPMGRSYERKELFGIDETKSNATHSTVIVRAASGPRVRVGSSFSLSGLRMVSWRALDARVLATFEDGTPAIVAKKYGKGTVFTILPDANTAAQKFPALVRDLLDSAVVESGKSPLVDVEGSNENTDLAISATSEGFRIAIVNYNDAMLDVRLRAVAFENGEWRDLESEKELTHARSLKLSVSAHKVRVVEFKRK